MSPVMLIHIVAGSLALASGAAAFVLRKGRRPHARAGTVFVMSMVVMTLTGSVIAALKPERATAVIGIITCYLVVTGWRSATRRDGRPGHFERVGFGVILACAMAELTFALFALNSPNGTIDSLPYQPVLVFAGLAALAAALDLRFILRGQLSGMQRVGRHLWRMGTAMLIATTSFFQGQQDEFPDAVRGSPLWYLPALAVFAAMLFWIFRVRAGRAWRKWPPGERVTSSSREPSSAPERAESRDR